MEQQMFLNLVPRNDTDVSLQKQILFKVCKRNQKGKKWEPVADDIVGLDKAIEITKTVDSEHISIFVWFNTGGSFYWSSDSNPTAFNSRLIHDDFYRDSYKQLGK